MKDVLFSRLRTNLTEKVVEYGLSEIFRIVHLSIQISRSVVFELVEVISSSRSILFDHEFFWT